VERKKRTTLGVPTAVVKRVLKACKAEQGIDTAGGVFMAMAMPALLSAPSSSSASSSSSTSLLSMSLSLSLSGLEGGVTPDEWTTFVAKVQADHGIDAHAIKWLPQNRPPSRPLLAGSGTTPTAAAAAAAAAAEVIAVVLFGIASEIEKSKVGAQPPLPADRRDPNPTHTHPRRPHRRACPLLVCGQMAIERLIDEHEADIAHQRSSKGGRLRLRQPAALTVDWRVLPLQLCGSQHVVGSPTVHGHHPHSHHTHTHTHGQGGGALLTDTLLSDPFLAKACRITAQFAPRHWATPAQLAFAAGATVTVSYDRAAALAVAALSHSHTAAAHGGGAKEAHALAQSLALDVRPAAPPAAASTSSTSATSSSNSTGVPAAVYGVYGGPGPGVSESNRRTLLFHLRGLVRRLKLSVPGGVCLHATSLLLRYVRRWLPRGARLTLVGDDDTCALACIIHSS
jgi:hypothetical protein